MNRPPVSFSGRSAGRTGSLLSRSSRQLSLTSAAFQSAVKKAFVLDPIQRLFVAKLQDYAKKSEAAGGAMVEAGPEWEAMMKAERTKLATIYGDKHGDVNQVPTFEFREPEFTGDASPNWEMPNVFDKPKLAPSAST